MTPNSVWKPKNDHLGAQERRNTRVAVLLMRNLGEALQFEEQGSATSEVRWLSPEQFSERDGRIRLLPETASALLGYAKANHLHPLGVVILDEYGLRTDVLIAGPISPEYRQAAKRLLRDHASFWLLYPSETARGASDET